MEFLLCLQVSLFAISGKLSVKTPVGERFKVSGYIVAGDISETIARRAVRSTAWRHLVVMRWAATPPPYEMGHTWTWAAEWLIWSECPPSVRSPDETADIDGHAK